MTRRIAILLVAALAAAFVAPARSAEGMWTLDNPPTAGDAGRARLGAATARGSTSAMHGAARLGGGCSSSFVSKTGLVLTNHHCVADCLEQISTRRPDLLAAGFLARGERRGAAVPGDGDRPPRADHRRDGRRDEGDRGLAGNAFKTAQNAVEGDV